uniref:Uncharacterized protein n=1 Tax=Arundo donax TaxID=35708 RepID=A0A0A9E2I7_ARUDO
MLLVSNHPHHTANKDTMTREGMIQTCRARAASSRTLETIPIALLNGSLMEACFATRRGKSCHDNSVEILLWQKESQLEQIKWLMDRRICMRRRRDQRDGSHGRSLASARLITWET